MHCHWWLVFGYISRSSEHMRVSVQIQKPGECPFVFSRIGWQEYRLWKKPCIGWSASFIHTSQRPALIGIASIDLIMEWLRMPIIIPIRLRAASPCKQALLPADHRRHRRVACVWRKGMLHCSWLRPNDARDPFPISIKPLAMETKIIRMLQPWKMASCLNITYERYWKIPIPTSPRASQSMSFAEVGLKGRYAEGLFNAEHSTAECLWKCRWIYGRGICYTITLSHLRFFLHFTPSLHAAFAHACSC